MTPDGKYVVFTSSATNLVAGAGFGKQVYVFDVARRSIEMVSVNSDGVKGNDFSTNPDISDDGRYVVFQSDASNLIGDGQDTNNVQDIFRRDRMAGITERVSVPAGGGQTINVSHGPSISGDGNIVGFVSLSPGIVPGKISNAAEVIVRDMSTGTNEWISFKPNPPSGNLTGGSNPELSHTGRFVAFTASTDFTVDNGTPNSFSDIYLRDRQTGAIEQISLSSSETEGNHAGSGEPTISESGRYVAFRSGAHDLVPGDTAYTDIFLRDRDLTTTVRLSQVDDSTGPNGDSGHPSITPDGSVVAYHTFAQNLLPPGEVGFAQVVRHDLATGTRTRVSHSYTGSLPNGTSFNPVISANGSRVAFMSNAKNILPGDSNNTSDVFVRDLGDSFAIPAWQTFGSCGQGLHGVNPSACQSDPVNSATGAFTHHETDITLPGIGLPFSFGRSYTSADPTDGPLGVGWTHSSNATLDIDPGGDVVLRGEDGQRITYLRRPDGTFWGAAGARSRLKEVSGGYELSRPDQVVYGFDPSGYLVEIRDRNGNQVTLDNGSDGLPDTITDTAGRDIDLTYDASDHLIAVELPDGRSVSFTYSGGRLASATDLRGKTTTYGYAGGLLSSITDPNGDQQIENLYDDGRIIEQTDAMGETGTFDWDPGTETATMTDAKGQEWVDVYERGVLVSRTDPLGNATSFGYDADLNLAEVTDPAGNTWTMTYDARGNLLKRVPPGATISANTYSYNAMNDLTSVRQDATRITTFTYDAAGNLIKVTRPGSNITLFGRDPAGPGLLVSTTDPEAHTTLFGYDPDGNLEEITTPLGHTTTMAYDGSGRMTSMVEPRGNAPGATPADYTWAFAYDDGDNLLTRTDPLGNATSWTYGDAGYLDTMEDAKGRIIGYGYNDAGELTSVDPPGPVGATTYTYDERGALETRTDPKAHVTSYSYDDAGRLAEVEDPLGRVWTYAHDPNGNLEKVTTAAGTATPASGDGEISYFYDARNSLTGIDYSDATPDVTFEHVYDEAGGALLTEMTDGAGTETYGYDDLDRLTEVERGTQAFSYGYDDAGNLTQRTYPDGTVVSLTYDAGSRLDLVTTGTQVTDHTWDAAGNLTQLTLPNATVEARSYDRAGRLTQVAHTGASGALSTYAYTLDQTGNPTVVQSPEGRITYGYDQLDRLTEACYGAACPTAGERIAYGYDAVGNRSSETRTPGGTTTYAYDAADQLTSTTAPGPLGGTTAYAFDDNGNQTQAGARSLTYDLANRLTSVTEGATTTAYSYDGMGRRLEATTGSQTAAYTWDPNASLPLLVRESDGAGALLRRYVYGADLISQTTPGASRFYHHDGLGSAVALSSATGTVEARYAYEPYGSPRAAAGLPPLPGSPPPPANPMRFTGEYLDDHSGLYHLRAREYDPRTGQFPQVDPLAQSMTTAFVGPYVYVGDHPTALVDPSGRRGTVLAYLTGERLPPPTFPYSPEIYGTVSGPRAHDPFGECSAPDWIIAPYLGSCLVHDYASDLIREEVLPPEADAIVDEIFRQDYFDECNTLSAAAICWIDSWLVWMAVRPVKPSGPVDFQPKQG